MTRFTRQIQNDRITKGTLFRIAKELELDRQLALSIFESDPEAIKRWALLGKIPAEEDPRYTN